MRSKERVKDLYRWITVGISHTREVNVMAQSQNQNQSGQQGGQGGRDGQHQGGQQGGQGGQQGWWWQSPFRTAKSGPKPAWRSTEQPARRSEAQSTISMNHV